MEWSWMTACTYSPHTPYVTPTQDLHQLFFPLILFMCLGVRFLMGLFSNSSAHISFSCRCLLMWLFNIIKPNVSLLVVLRIEPKDSHMLSAHSCTVAPTTLVCCCCGRCCLCFLLLFLPLALCVLFREQLPLPLLQWWSWLFLKKLSSFSFPTGFSIYTSLSGFPIYTSPLSGIDFVCGCSNTYSIHKWDRFLIWTPISSPHLLEKKVSHSSATLHSHKLENCILIHMDYSVDTVCGKG